VELQVLTSDEWEIWKQARLRALADAADAFGSSLAEWETADERGWRERLEDVPFNVVAVDGDVVVGQASGTGLYDANRIELISMWVAPDARGLGVADSLISAVVGYGSGVGATALRLSVRRANHRAIRFYQRVGFQFVDEPGDEPAELAMLKPLGR
jgi:ribosomal protein S18 acetylase RimI-like enzyme